MTLRVCEVQCALREVVLRDKPAHMLEISPKGTVPVLQLPDGAVIEESIDIMRWALADHDPQGWLRPDRGTTAEADALIETNDEDFKHHLDRYKYANRYEGADPTIHRAEAERFLRVLDDRLTDAPALFGGHWTLADVAIGPFIRQFANADRDWFDTAPYPHLQRWLGAFLADERFTAVMTKYPQWNPGDAEPIFPPSAGSDGSG